MKANKKYPLAVCLGLSLCLMLFGVTGCSEEAEHLYEIAEMEEERNNPTDARKLYQRIIQIDPKGYFATKARERLAELDKLEAESKQEPN
ncbi:MAG: hypothetical protein GTO40_12840 [Deltaproteobacteria bacterium]|nr:hypothetical protein [Deltaproteobacteria bacterium]